MEGVAERSLSHSPLTTTTNTAQPRDDHTAAFGLLRVLRRRLPLIVLCVIALPAGALTFSLLQHKEYSTTASLLFRDPQFDQKLFGSTAVPTNVDPTREAATNVELVSLDVVADRVARKLGGGLTGTAVTNEVQVASAGKSDVVSITATDRDPDQAARIANTFAEQYIVFRRAADRSKIQQAQTLVKNQITKLSVAARNGPRGRSLEGRSEQLGILASLQTGNAELVQPATVPTSPSFPRPVRNTAIGVILGILLGLGLALLFERFDRRLKHADDIADAFDRPVLGAIPESRVIARPDQAQATAELPAGEAEAFRMLRANLRYFNVDQRVVSVLITSASPMEGKSMVAVHLASAAGRAGAKVLLLEADLRRPTIGSKLGITSAGGLSLVLSGDMSLEHAAQAVDVAGPGAANARPIDVVLAGPIPPNPADLIESESMRQIIENAETTYDLVVVDTPPTSVVSDAIPLVKEVSGVIVVTRLGRTTRESAAHLRGQLENLDANTLGVVVNSVSKSGGGGYGYGYGYGALPSDVSARSRAASPPTKARQADLNGNDGTPLEDDELATPTIVEPLALTAAVQADESESHSEDPTGDAHPPHQAPSGPHWARTGRRWARAGRRWVRSR